MTNIIPFVPSKHSAEELREQACAWIVKLDEGLANKDAVRAWIGNDPERIRLLMEAACLWDQTSLLEEYAELFRAVNAPRPGFRGITAVRAVAASLLVVVLGFGGMYLSEIGLFSAARPEMALQAFETQVGERTNLILSDGSELVLNTNTRVEVSYGADSRKVSLLRGEAHFQVRRDSARPFVVEAGGALIEAVGTAFAVHRISGEGLEVTVTEGVVNFHRDADPGAAASATRPNVRNGGAAEATRPVQVVAGESARLEEGSDSIEKMSIEASELEAKLAWRGGMLQFQGDTLEQAIKEVSRYTSIRIDIDESIKDIEVIGYFQTGNIDGLLRAMSRTFNLQYVRIDENHILLSAQ